MESLINFVQDEFIEKKISQNSQQVILSLFIMKSAKEKKCVRSFSGVVIQIKGQELSKTFTIEKCQVLWGRTYFPNQSSCFTKNEVNKRGKVRRARIYYFRELRGKKHALKSVNNNFLKVALAAFFITSIEIKLQKPDGKN